jgi:hypothetical protein
MGGLEEKNMCWGKRREGGRELDEQKSLASNAWNASSEFSFLGQAQLFSVRCVIPVRVHYVPCLVTVM